MSPRVKVLRIIARLNVGGPARHVALLQTHLAPLGYDSLLIYGRPGPGERELPLDPGVAAEQVASLGPSVRFAGDFVALLRLVRLLFRFKPEVVHTHTAKAGALGRLAAFVYNRTVPRARRCVVIHTFHGHVFRGYFSPRVSRIVQVAERLLARVTDRIIAISPSQQRDLVETFHIAPADKVVVVPLGLNLDPLAATTADGRRMRRDAGFADDARVCGFVGRLVPIKHLDLLLRACSEAFREVPQGRLLVVGDGECRAALEAASAADAALWGHVHFAGWQADLAEVYAAMDVVALSSINEGTPVALIEAMAAGRAVVSTDAGGVADVVTSGVTGLVVPQGDPHALAAALARLLADPSERARLGSAARADVLERFSYRRLVHDIDRVYKDTIRAVRAADATRGAAAVGARRVRD